MNLERISLPGIGLRHVLTTEHERRIGVISHRSGRQDLVIYDREDPDIAELLRLTPTEAGTLAELLGTAQIVERISELHRKVDGLVSLQVTITANGRYTGKSLAETRTRTRTGAFIVAVVRDRDIIATPRSDFVFGAGDVIVLFGTPEGTRAAASMLCDG